MKNIIYIGIFAVTAFAIYAFMNPKADFNKDDKEGIQFHRGTWKEALEEAGKQNKLVFLDVYAVWCGPCRKLKNNTFSNSKVGKYFNENFINVSLDGETGEGAMVANRYKVTGYPTLLFIDKDGKVVKQAVGYHDADDLIRLGQSAIK